MSKTLAAWTVVFGILLAVLGLWAISEEPGRRAAESSIFSEGRETEPPPPSEAPTGGFDPGKWAP
jgi:hypothetical protein